MNIRLARSATLLLLITFWLSLAACGGKNKGTPQDDAGTDAATGCLPKSKIAACGDRECGIASKQLLGFNEMLEADDGAKDLKRGYREAFALVREFWGLGCNTLSGGGWSPDECPKAVHLLEISKLPKP